MFDIRTLAHHRQTVSNENFRKQSGSVIEERKKKPVSEQQVNETNKVAFFGHQDVIARKNEAECAIDHIEAQAISEARTAGQDPRQKATLLNQGGISKQSVTNFTEKIGAIKKCF